MPLHVHEKLLLTGAAGALGQALRSRLKANCTVLRVSDLNDLGAAAAVERAVAGVSAIAHLGGYSVEGPFAPILQANIIGVFNLDEAARKHGVPRVVFASSNHVTGYYRQSETLTADHPPRPDGLYGVSKAFGEDLSRFYFDRHGIETACVRIGSSFPEPRDRRMLATWLSHDDLHRLVSACLDTRVLGHSIVFGMSDNAVTWWDNSRARHIGYRPQDSSDVFRETVYARAPPRPERPGGHLRGRRFRQGRPVRSLREPTCMPNGLPTPAAPPAKARSGSWPSRPCTGWTWPPVGDVLFVGSAVGKRPIEQVVKALTPFFFALFPVLLAVTYIPALSLWLPGLVLGN